MKYKYLKEIGVALLGALYVLILLDLFAHFTGQTHNNSFYLFQTVIVVLVVQIYVWQNWKNDKWVKSEVIFGDKEV